MFLIINITTVLFGYDVLFLVLKYDFDKISDLDIEMCNK